MNVYRCYRISMILVQDLKLRQGIWKSGEQETYWAQSNPDKLQVLGSNFTLKWWTGLLKNFCKPNQVWLRKIFRSDWIILNNPFQNPIFIVLVTDFRSTKRWVRYRQRKSCGNSVTVLRIVLGYSRNQC